MTGYINKINAFLHWEIQVKYKVINETVKAGFFSDAQDKIEKKIQPLLDAGTKKGWKLHSFNSTDTTKGINLVFIWEIEQD